MLQGKTAFFGLRPAQLNDREFALFLVVGGLDRQLLALGRLQQLIRLRTEGGEDIAGAVLQDAIPCAGAAAVQQVQIRSPTEQHANDLGPGRQMQGTLALLVERIGVGSLFEQEARGLAAVVLGRVVQGGPACFGIGRVDIARVAQGLERSFSAAAW